MKGIGKPVREVERPDLIPVKLPPPKPVEKPEPAPEIFKPKVPSKIEE